MRGGTPRLDAGFREQSDDIDDGERSEDPDPLNLAIHVGFHSRASIRLDRLVHILLPLRRDRRAPAFGRGDVLHAGVCRKDWLLGTCLRQRLPRERRALIHRPIAIEHQTTKNPDMLPTAAKKSCES
jgi:hypothetical protein